MEKKKITWVKSAIGHRKEHRDVVRSLGLKRLNHSVEKEWTPSIRGMVDKVSYLLKVEDVE